MPIDARQKRSATLAALAAILAAAAYGCSSNVHGETAVPGLASRATPNVIQGGGSKRWIQFALPTQNSEPFGITVGPDGNLWFSELGANKIGRLTPSGQLSEFRVPTSSGSPIAIAVGPDGALWFTELGGNKIGRITTSGSITEYHIPTLHSQPMGLAAGPDGALWFVESSQTAHKVGRITTTGTITEYQAGFRHLYFIVAGADGRLWYTGGSGGAISAITTTGHVTHYATKNYTYGLTLAFDGNIWFTEMNHTIGSVTPAGVVTEYPIPGTIRLSMISQAPGGWLWISEPNSPFGPSQFARFDPVSQQYKDTLTLPSIFQGPEQSISGPDGNLWFADFYGSDIGVYVIQVMTVSPKNLSFSVPNQTAQVDVSEKQYSGGFSAVSTNPGVATVAPVGPPGAFIVTSVGAGSCKIEISDSQQNSVSVRVRVQ